MEATKEEEKKTKHTHCVMFVIFSLIGRRSFFVFSLLLCCVNNNRKKKNNNHHALELLEIYRIAWLI
jgi:hypothetical protein